MIKEIAQKNQKLILSHENSHGLSASVLAKISEGLLLRTRVRAFQKQDNDLQRYALGKELVVCVGCGLGGTHSCDGKDKTLPKHQPCAALLQPSQS